MGVVLGQVDEVEHDHAAGQGKRGLHRVRQPAPGRLLHGQPVDDHLNVVLLVLLQRRQLAPRALRGNAVQPDHNSVDPGPGVALGLQLAEHLHVLALAAADHRRQDLEPGALLKLHHPVDDLLRALPRDRPAADRAVRLSGPGIQQPQVVIHLGDRADGRARVAARRLLVDRDRRRQPIDEVDVGLVHLPEELPGVGRQRLDVPALPLGKDRVKSQARLARPRQSGEDDQGITRQVQRYVLQVVLARTADDETVSHFELSAPIGMWRMTNASSPSTNNKNGALEIPVGYRLITAENPSWALRPELVVLNAFASAASEGPQTMARSLVQMFVVVRT